MAAGIMSLGSFIFAVDTATYDRLTRTDEWRWVTQERLNNVPAEQFVGYGSTTIMVEGSIFPLKGVLLDSWNPNDLGSPQVYSVVGTNQLEYLRQIANSKSPQSLVDGRGKNYGQFVITKITEIQSSVFDNGAPRKQDFTIELRSYGPDDIAAFLLASAVQAGKITRTLFTGIVNQVDDALRSSGLPENTVGLGLANIAAGAVGADLAKQAGLDVNKMNADYGGKLASTLVNTIAPPAPNAAADGTTGPKTEDINDAASQLTDAFGTGP